MNLYDIDSRIYECVDLETGEIFMPELFEALQIERSQAIEQLACMVKNLLSDADQLEREADNLYNRADKARRKAQSAKDYLQRYMEGEKFQSSKVAISYRNTKKTDIFNESLLPDEFFKEKTFREPSKTLVKKAIDEGRTVPGAKITESVNMYIK